MARDQARRLKTCEAALGSGSLQQQIEALSDMHLVSLVVIEDMNAVHGFMDHGTLVRRFLTAVRRGRAFTLPGWTAAMGEEFEARLRQGGAHPSGGVPEGPGQRR